MWTGSEGYWVGSDGCRVGWLTIALGDNHSWKYSVDFDVDSLWRRWRNAFLILIDIPIGLVDEGVARECDVAARKAIKPRSSSVFPAPSRGVLSCDTYQQGCDANEAKTGRRLSKQTWAIIPKIREVDELLAAVPKARSKVREVHPEVLFWAMNGRLPLQTPKKTVQGFEERVAILERHYSGARAVAYGVMAEVPKSVATPDDVLDALAAAVTAFVSHGELQTLPEVPQMDSAGLPMEMVFWSGPGQPAH